ncbi:MAG: DUF89 family protein [Clostridiales bacterium]|nr:DUF89 family protein [Clostridiales bacterium]
MEIFLDCLPCLLRQGLEASRLATDRVDLQNKIMEDSIQILSRYKDYRCSPDLCRSMHQAVKKHTGLSDPYAEIKARDIRAAKAILPDLFAFLKSKQNSLYWALKIAATGNIIDSAVNHNADMIKGIETELEKEFSVCDLALFEEKLKTAKNVLIIADNAGETVFDRVLAERLAPLDIIYAVRSEPTINDATMEDARASGLADVATIVSTGCSAPGAILDDCSEAFLNLFDSADVVISTGQGNYEAVSGCGKPAFFLLKAKCPIISQKLGVDLNGYVFKYI